MLSGFVLAYSYGDRLSTLRTVLPFMVLRLIRLYPLYLAGLVLGILAYLLNAGAEGAFWPSAFVASAVFNALFLPVPPGLSIVDVHPFPFVFPAWSLFWEMGASLLLGLAAPFLTTRRLVLLVAISAGLVIALALTVGSLDVGSNYSSFVGGGPRISFAFFAGILMHRAWATGACRIVIPTWAASVALVLLLTIPAPDAYRGVLDALIVVIAFPTLLSVSMGVVASAPAKFLGRISYPLYICHVPVFALALFMGERFASIPESSLGSAVSLFAIATSALRDSIELTCGCVAVLRRGRVKPG